MADYGFKTSLRGYDIKDCDDRFLSYSSSFNTLKVFSKTVVTSSTLITINHNLGEFAPFIVFENNSGKPSYDVKQYINKIEVNGEDELARTFTIFLFLNNFDTIAENIVGSATTLGALSSDYGLKVSKDGYDVKTCTDDQLVFSSSYFSDLINIQGSDLPSSTGITTVSHGLGYSPDFLAFRQKTGESFIAPHPFDKSGEERASIDDTDLTIFTYDDRSLGTYIKTTTYYYVIFKRKIN